MQHALRRGRDWADADRQITTTTTLPGAAISISTDAYLEPNILDIHAMRHGASNAIEGGSGP